MPTKIVPFFATNNDLIELLDRFLSEQQLQLVRAGTLDAPPISYAHQPTQLDSNTNYLICNKDSAIHFHRSKQINGEEKIVIDQSLNPNTAVLRSGGLVKGNCLISGQVGTISASKDALHILSLLSCEIHKQFTKIKSYYVGQEAARLLDSGTRLTANLKGSTLYDLSRN